VLALQGDFERHLASLEALAVEGVRVVNPRDFDGLDALLMPGGESTTMLKLLDAGGLRPSLEAFVRGRPVMGTCAGVILLGTEATRLPAPPLGVLDVTVERNAYGRQIDSFSREIDAPVLGGRFLGVFIRAPRIRRVGEGVEVIATQTGVDGRTEPVGVRRGVTVGLCFHPELTNDLRFHRWFLSDVAGLALPGDAAATVPTARRDASPGERA
jgi:5'-phosphate synthase pdxT subunit